MSKKQQQKLYSLEEPSELTMAEYQDLLSQIPDLSPEDRQLELWDGARYNDMDVVRAILKVCHDEEDSIINAKNPETGNTALHMASANGHVDLVRFLLHNQADAQIANAAGNTPLHWAASNGQEAVCKVLLESSQSIDVLQKNDFGRSALTEGFASGKESVIQSLLEHDSATEERLLSTSGATNGDGTDQKEVSVIHEMVFGSVKVKVRELSMASSVDDAILGSADNDTTGLGIWPASLVAAQWIARESRLCADCTTVLELGAGCGVPSLVAAAMSQNRARVYATDWNARSLENLQYNVTLNQLAILPQCMDWSDKSTWPQEKIDLLIGSDLVYTMESVPLLVSTIMGLLSQSGRFIYTAPATLCRQGKDEFIKRMQEHFVVKSLPAPPEYATNPLASGDDDECFLHFNELQSDTYMLYEFVRNDSMDIDEA